MPETSDEGAKFFICIMQNQATGRHGSQDVGARNALQDVSLGGLKKRAHAAPTGRKPRIDADQCLDMAGHGANAVESR